MNELTNGPEWQVRPMGIGEILTRIRQIFTAQWRLFLKQGLVPAAGMVLLYALMFGVMYARGMVNAHEPSPDPAKILTIMPLLLLASVPFLLVYVLYEGAIIHASLVANRGGASSFEESYRVAWTNFGRLLGLSLLRLLYIVLPGAVVACLLVAVVAMSEGGLRQNPGALAMLMPLLFLTYLGAMAWGIWMGLRLMLAMPALLVENVSATEALRRSAKLSAGAKGREFVVMLVLYLCAMVGIFALELVVTIVAVVVVLLGAVAHVPPPVALAMGVPAAILLFFGLMLCGTLQWASMGIACAVMYDDQRFREQGVTALTGETA